MRRAARKCARRRRPVLTSSPSSKPSPGPAGRCRPMGKRSSWSPTFLWTRRLDASAPVRVSGTDDAMYPFWSPDGGEVGFFTANRLKRISVERWWRALDVCNVAVGRGGAWFDDGTIVFVDVERKGLKRASASGGDAAILLPVDGAPGFIRFSFPVRVGARQVLFLAVAADPSRSELRVASLDVPGKSATVVRSSWSAAYANGFLFFDRDGVAVAQRFDARTGTLTGELVVLTGSVGGKGHVGYRNFLAGGRTVAWWTTSRHPPADLADRSGLAFDATGHGNQTFIPLNSSKTTAVDPIRPRRHPSVRRAAQRLVGQSGGGD